VESSTQLFFQLVPMFQIMRFFLEEKWIKILVQENLPLTHIIGFRHIQNGHVSDLGQEPVKWGMGHIQDSENFLHLIDKCNEAIQFGELKRLGVPNVLDKGRKL